MKNDVIRKPAMLAQTILRLILLTGGSGVLSTTLPAGCVFAIAGKGCFTGVEVAGGAPAGTVSPGFGVGVLLADDSLEGVSTMKPSVGLVGQIHFNAAEE
jgi:hypothetical protein